MTLRFASNLLEEIASGYAMRPHGRKQNYLSEWAEEIECSIGTLYRKMKQFGVTHRKRTRLDSGTSRITYDHALIISAIKEQSRRKNNQIIMRTATAIDIASANGLIPAEVALLSENRWNQLLRRYRLDSKSLSLTRVGGEIPAMHIERRPEYPGHVYQADVSPCLQMKLNRRGGVGFEPENRFYGKDVEHYLDKNGFIFRYAVVDMFTRLLFVRYYHARGENSKDWVDFLIHAFLRKRDAERNPMEGVPTILIADNGSAVAKASVTQNLLKGLGVDFRSHLPGNPAAKGGIETHHRHWQSWFESRLAFKKISSINEINIIAEGMLAEYNSKVPLTVAGGKTRNRLFYLGLPLVPAGRYPVLPKKNMDATIALAHKKPVKKRVGRSGYIRLNGEDWRVSNPDLIGLEVQAYPSPYNSDELIVHHGCDVYSAVRIKRNRFGFALDAPSWDEFKRMPDGTVDKNIKRIRKVAREQLGDINPFIQNSTDMDMLPSTSTPRPVIDIPDADNPILTDTAARTILLNDLGIRLFRKREVARRIDDALKGGLTRSEVMSLAEKLKRIDSEVKS